MCNRRLFIYDKVDICDGVMNALACLVFTFESIIIILNHIMLEIKKKINNVMIKEKIRKVFEIYDDNDRTG